MNKEATSPAMAARTPLSGTQLSGVLLTCSCTARESPSKLIDPMPSGSRTVLPGRSRIRNGSPSGLRNCSSSSFSSTYTDCGSPAICRLPW
jgi:hypothetical protein